jgi:hypothetical protein
VAENGFLLESYLHLAAVLSSLWEAWEEGGGVGKSLGNIEYLEMESSCGEDLEKCRFDL